MVIKKKDDKEEEVQNGWVGHVIPFDLVQTKLLREDYDALKAKEARLDEIAAELTEIIDSIDEGDRGEFLNDDNTAFVPKAFAVLHIILFTGKALIRDFTTHISDQKILLTQT